MENYGYPQATGGDLTAEYVLTTLSPDLLNGKLLTPGPGVIIIVSGNAVTISAAGGSGSVESYLTVNTEAGLINSRKFVTGANLDRTDGGTGSSFTLKVNPTSTDTSNVTLLITSKSVRFSDATTGTITYTLPLSNGTNVDKEFHIKKIDSSANFVVLSASGSDKVDGASTFSIKAQYEAYTIRADGLGNWFLF